MRTRTAAELTGGLSARDGDVLVVSYPEHKIGCPGYSSVTVGGQIYTRRLVEGDDVGEQYDKVYAFLKARAEAAAKTVLAEFLEELKSVPKR